MMIYLGSIPNLFVHYVHFFHNTQWRRSTQILFYYLFYYIIHTGIQQLGRNNLAKLQRKWQNEKIRNHLAHIYMQVCIDRKVDTDR